MNNKKPLIGILGHFNNNGDVGQPGYGQNREYIRYFRRFGNVIILDAQNTEILPLDMLVLPGGRDVNPLTYNARPSIYTQSPDLEYEYFMKHTLEKYIKERVVPGNMAIYGICAGFQNLVVHFGGRLSQHINQKQSGDRYNLVDELVFNSNNEYIREVDKSMINRVDFKKTNSIHHQGVFHSGMPDSLEIMATNKAFRNVEFFSHKKLLIAAEQSHPEERLDPLLSDYLIGSLLEKVNKKVENEEMAHTN